jgi:uncharacterized protein (DUF488 family)
MAAVTPKIIYTIGHSTHPIDKFLSMLDAFAIHTLVDVRNFPGSRKYPQYNQENLQASLKNAGIEYIHLKDLGGRRKPVVGSKNNRWRSDAFRGYADYMEGAPFKKAVKELEKYAAAATTAFMCSEAVWWRCHRSLIADYLKVNGWKVMHIQSEKKAEEHPYTSPAQIVDGRLSYSDSTLF